MVCKIFETRTGLGVSVIEYLAENLHKPAIKTFKRINVYARFKGNIWEADLAEMGSLLNVKQLLCVTKYAQVKTLKDKRAKTVLNTLIKIVNESNCKPNKFWVDQGKEFYNKLMQE